MGRDFGKSRNFSEEVAATIDSEIRRLVDVAYKKAEKLLQENLHKLHAVAQALLEKEKIDAKEFEEVFNNANINQE